MVQTINEEATWIRMGRIIGLVGFERKKGNHGNPKNHINHSSDNE